MVEWLSVIAIGAAAVPVTLLACLIVWSVKRAARYYVRRYRARKGGIRYEGVLGDVQVPRVPYHSDGWTGNKRAQELLFRLCHCDEKALEYMGKGFEVTGGATGHKYRVYSRCVFPIDDLTEGSQLCAKPYNAYSIPEADTMLTIALYLQCPETELAFRAICNKVPGRTYGHPIYPFQGTAIRYGAPYRPRV